MLHCLRFGSSMYTVNIKSKESKVKEELITEAIQGHPHEAGEEL